MTATVSALPVTVTVASRSMRSRPRKMYEVGLRKCEGKSTHDRKQRQELSPAVVPDDFHSTAVASATTTAAAARNASAPPKSLLLSLGRRAQFDRQIRALAPIHDYICERRHRHQNNRCRTVQLRANEPERRLG